MADLFPFYLPSSLSPSPQFFSFINVITSFCVVAKSAAGEGFAAFWSMAMVVCVAFGGTAVFRKYQTEVRGSEEGWVEGWAEGWA